MWQLDHRQPEIVDALHNIEESAEVYWLGDVTVRMKQIASQDIRLRGRGSQNNNRNALQCLTLLDFRQNLPAVFLGQVQIEQDEVRAWRIDIMSLEWQESHSFCPI